MPASTYTRGQIRSDIKTSFAPEGDSTLADSFYNRRIDQAVQRIVREVEVPDLERIDETLQLATNTRSYDLTALSPEPYLIRGVKDLTADLQLEIITIEEAESWDEDATGPPSHWLRYGTDLRIYPKPSSDYNNDFLRLYLIDFPAVMSTDSSVSPLPAYLDRALLDLATGLVFLDDNEPERARIKFIAYRSAVQAAEEVAAREIAYADRSLGPPSRTGYY